MPEEPKKGDHRFHNRRPTKPRWTAIASARSPFRRRPRRREPWQLVGNVQPSERAIAATLPRRSSARRGRNENARPRSLTDYVTQIQWDSITPRFPVSAEDTFNGAVKARLDLLGGGVGDAELRGNFLQGTLFEHDGTIDALGLFRSRRLGENMLDRGLPHGDLPRGIHKCAGVAVRKRRLIPYRFCSAVKCGEAGLLGAIAVNEQSPCRGGKVIAELTLLSVDATLAQHIGQADKDLLNGILDICGGERLADGLDEVPQRRRVKLDELEPDRRIVALREIGDFLQERLWRFRKHLEKF